MSTTTVFPSQPSSTRPPNNDDNGNNGGGGPTSSPLLFFVALGFGVVFTNLWIIVGVKYCFRYNRRRAAQTAASTEIDMANMPRPHRRRREKKLMTMDEVNERFPLTKYKQWKSSRETEGLPSNGGISTAPQSRAASIKDVEVAATSQDEGPGPRTETALSMARNDHAAQNSTSQQTASPRSSVESTKGEKMHDSEKQIEKDSPVPVKPKESPEHGAAPQATVHEHDDDSDDDDDDPIRTATAPELLSDPGDTCAICIDLLEDDEDVRGLACGHAFHASCVDPWLTSRRACCPLCKADYYVPKPRPEGEADPATGRRSAAGPRSPQQAVWTSANPFSRTQILIINADPNQQPSPQRLGRLGLSSRRSHPVSAESQQGTAQPRQGSSWFSRTTPSQPRAPMFSRWFNRDRSASNNVNTSTATQQPTPGQLEAGTR
ncbi:hypothetical protein COCVIDRAFT_90262 [Bipolaris victoriae FI3]|uniref:RING-type domain-containing protein n=1 Tax=Bipolaris victoriae (strain FI3) TaxID=930091 RepID=W7EQY6_BIPV3|nr:hypothetical protein COCVIDRAFT_90262 [Bipolaris victoriae FI3]